MQAVYVQSQRNLTVTVNTCIKGYPNVAVLDSAAVTLVRDAYLQALLSRVYDAVQSLILKVINDSNYFVTFKKGKKIYHAESAVPILEPIGQYRLSITTSHVQKSVEQKYTLSSRPSQKHVRQ